MARIAKNIADGAMSFLKAEYKILSIFVVAVAILLFFKGQYEAGSNGLVAVSFIVGAVCSALAGFIGMRVATKANVRTTNAARTSLPKALEVAFAGGSVMGLGVVGLGVLGLGSLFAIYSAQGWGIDEVLNVLSGFSLGASSIALFARVGGGIYTKAADVGADWWVRLKPVFQKITRLTLLPLQITLVTTLEMWPEWALTFLNRM